MLSLLRTSVDDITGKKYDDIVLLMAAEALTELNNPVQALVYVVEREKRNKIYYIVDYQYSNVNKF